MRKKISIFVIAFTLLTVLLVPINISSASQSTRQCVYGPEIFQDKKNGTFHFSRQFTKPYAIKDAIVHISNGKEANERAVKGNIKLNGVIITTGQFALNRFVDNLDIPVILEDDNIIEVDFQGSTHAYLTISIDALPMVDLIMDSDPTTGYTPLEVSFNVSTKSAMRIPFDYYEWDFGENNTKVKTTGNIAHYQYEKSGKKIAKVYAHHPTGLVVTAESVINVQDIKITPSMELPSYYVSGSFPITAHVETIPPTRVSAVDFYLDDLFIGTATESGSSYTIKCNTNNIANGDHVVKVVARVGEKTGETSGIISVLHNLPSFTYDQNNKTTITLSKYIGDVRSYMSGVQSTLNGIPMVEQSGAYILQDYKFMPGQSVNYVGIPADSPRLSINFTIPTAISNITTGDLNEWLKPQSNGDLLVTWTNPDSIDYTKLAFYIYCFDAQKKPLHANPNVLPVDDLTATSYVIGKKSLKTNTAYVKIVVMSKKIIGRHYPISGSPVDYIINYASATLTNL